MGDDSATRAQLTRRILARRADVARYVRSVRPWSNRLGTVSVLSSALVAVTTAGPALGGESFTSTVGPALGLPSGLPVWQVACVAALVVSLVSTVSSGLLRRQDVASRVAAAENATVELGALATAVEFGQVEIGDAVARFSQITATVPFVDEHEQGTDPAAGPIEGREPIPVVPGSRAPGVPPPGPRPFAGPPSRPIVPPRGVPRAPDPSQRPRPPATRKFRRP